MLTTQRLQRSRAFLAGEGLTATLRALLPTALAQPLRLLLQAPLTARQRRLQTMRRAALRLPLRSLQLWAHLTAAAPAVLLVLVQAAARPLSSSQLKRSPTQPPPRP